MTSDAGEQSHLTGQTTNNGHSVSGFNYFKVLKECTNCGITWWFTTSCEKCRIEFQPIQTKKNEPSGGVAKHRTVCSRCLYPGEPAKNVK